jgi:RHS repeat-associated protein
VESLEERAIPAAGLDLIYHQAGQIDRPGQKVHVSVPVPAADFTLPASGRVVLGFACEPAEGSSLDPAAFGLRASRGSAASVLRRAANLPGERTSLTLASVRPGGSFDLALKGSAKTTGAFDLSVFLAGDVNDDSRVDATDVAVIKGLAGVKSTDPRYQLEADVNRNGTIDRTDQKLAERNLGAVFTGTRAERRLHESSGLIAQSRAPVSLGSPGAGSRILRIPVRTHFDTTDAGAAAEDAFLIYLVDPTDPTHTLIDRGQQGTSLFSMAGGKSEMVPGRVRFDGSTVEVDVTALSESQGLLIFQLLNNDSDTGTSVHAGPATLLINAAGTARPAFPDDLDLAPAGPALDLSGLSATNGIHTRFQNVRVDAAGAYTAELVLHNDGTPVGREAAVVFTSLPAGVSLLNPSGSDAQNHPYINFHNAIPDGGLAAGQESRPIELTFTDPSRVPMRLTASVLTGGPNQAPMLDPIGPISITVGERLTVPITASDPDGDAVTLSVDGATLPTGGLSGSSLTLTPVPADIGTYSFDVVASDGALQSRQTVSLTVSADPDISTRLSGFVRDAAGNPLASVPVNLGATSTTTAGDGSFRLTFPGSMPAGPLVVQGDRAPGPVEYPLVKVDPALLLGRPVIDRIDNTIPRPIYLTAVDSANAGTVNPSVDTTISTPAIPGASLFIPANATSYSGPLAITQVERDHTSAALPVGTSPDMVVDVEPSGAAAGVQFTTPAALTLPNRAGWAAGRLFDLFALDPATGVFTDKGDAQVAAGGATILTTVGGVTDNGLCFFVPRPDTALNPAQVVFNEDTSGVEQTKTAELTSEVELHSGAVLETHDLVTYQSVAQTRGLSLRYDSLRADPRPIIHFGLPSVDPATLAGANSEHLRLVARMTIHRGSFTYDAPGAPAQLGLPAGYHFWQIPATGGRIEAALQLDLSSLPSGQYVYEVTVGVMLIDAGSAQAVGTSQTVTGRLIHINSIGSPLGDGWGLAGIQQIIENADGSVLHWDEVGLEERFGTPQGGGNLYIPSAGDFTVLEKVDEGSGPRFRRTTQDRTVSRFDANNRLASVTDRNGNQTTYAYDPQGRLTTVTDPVGLVTTLTYGAGFVEILDPAGRVTRLDLDTAGDLAQITDPDSSKRAFGYDGQHHLILEIDKRGFHEETDYGFHGRATRGVRGDGSVILVDPVQVHGLFRPEETINPTSPPTATALSTTGRSADPSGGVSGAELDQFGQSLSEQDALGTIISNVQRDSSNELTQAIQFGNRFEIVYDAAGRPIAIRDSLAQTTEGYNYLFGTSNGLYSPEVIATADFNLDGIADAACAADNGVAIFLGNGDGTFNLANAITGTTPQVLATDLNSDGKPDLVLEEEGTIRTFLGQGDGQFVLTDEVFLSIKPLGVALGDLNADGKQDLVATGSEIISLLGVGDGTFASPIFGDSAIGTKSIAVADLNGDGRADLVFARVDLNVYLSNGDGTFAPPVTYSSAHYYLVGIALADLNGDGHPDVAVHTVNGSSNQLSVLLNAGDGTLGMPTTVFNLENASRAVVRARDVTGDGVNDLVVIDDLHRLEILRGDGLGGFTQQPAIPGGTGIAFDDVAFADVDGDGDQDFLAATAGASFPFTRNLSVRLNDGTGALDPIQPHVRTANYDPTFHQLTETADALRRRTVYEIDPANGNRLKETRVVGSLGGGDDVEKLFTYTSRGQIDTAIDACGCSGVMDNDYDAFGRLIKTTFAAGTPQESTRLYEYDAAGNRTAEIDENGNRTEYAYDVMNRLIQVSQPDPDGAGPLLSPITQYSYDSGGIRVMTIDPLGHVTNQEFDPRNRIITRTEADPDGPGPIDRPTTRMDYDSSGNLLRQVDPLGRVTRYEYDARNRRVKTIDPAGGITLEEYDGAGNQTALVDPVGNRTTFTYDLRNHLLRETDSLGKSIVHNYDAADQLIRTVDRDGHSTLDVYDSLGRLVRESWSNSDGSTANVIQSSYDDRGNRLSATDNFSSLAFTFDARNRITSVDNAGTPGAPHVLLGYSYDGVGNVLSVSETINGQPGAVTAYTYDGLNRMTRITQSGGGAAEKRIDFEYNALGQTIELDRFADLAGTRPVIQSDFAYDGMNRLTSLTHMNGPDVVASYLQDFNLASEITRAVNSDGTNKYTYDLTGQLIGASRGGESFTYDPNGNRTGGHYQTGPGNRLLADGRYTYEYDGEGNLIKRTDTAAGRTREFVWDQRNRLVQVTDKDAHGNPTMIAKYTYDADDRRISKTVDTSPQDAVPGITTYFVYDREDVLLEFVDTDGPGGNPPVLSLRYLQGPGIDQVLAQEDVRVDINSPTRVLWLLPDPLGSTRDLVDQTGRVRNHIVYDAFGRVLSQTNPAFSTRYLFTGREFDAETGLYYYRSRYYDPRTGRFVSEDRIRFKAGDANLRRYVRNDPVGSIDPTGKDTRVNPFFQLFGFIRYFVTEGVQQDLCVSDYEEMYPAYVVWFYGVAKNGDYVITDPGKVSSWNPTGIVRVVSVDPSLGGRAEIDVSEYVKKSENYYPDLLKKTGQPCAGSVSWILLAGLGVIAVGRWHCGRRRRRTATGSNEPSDPIDQDDPTTPAK